MILDWSHSRLPPFKHQAEDTETLVNSRFFFITSEMRTGKTKIVIDAAQFLYLQGLIDKVVVVTPAPVRDVWFDSDIGELQKHLWKAINARITEYHSYKRAWLWGQNDPDKLEWVITNFEFLRRKERLKVLKPFCDSNTLLVGDESSFLKNHKAKQTEAFEELRWLCARVVLLNGTPIDHSPMDLFSQGNILHPSILQCKFITHFRNDYAVMAPVLGAGGKPIPHLEVVKEYKNLDILRKKFEPYVVRRLQADCLDLPKKLDPVTLVATLDSEWPIYKKMRDECVVLFEQESNESTQRGSAAAQAVVKTIRLAQITSGFLGGMQDFDIEPEIEDTEEIGGLDADGNFVISNSTRNDNQEDTLWGMLSREEGQGTVGPTTPSRAISTVREIGRAKLDVVLWFIEQRLEEQPNPHIIVWSRFRPELDRLIREVNEKYPQFVTGTMRGGQKKIERNTTMKLLHPDSTPWDKPVFVAGMFGTGSYGLNFTGASYCLDISYDFRFGKYKQAMDRVYGPGMTRPVAFFNIVAVGPQGQKTYDHQIIKARMQNEEIANWTMETWIRRLKDE